MLNTCTGAYDIVYDHYYRANLPDCSLDNSCGSWGPIIEVFTLGEQPQIKELGFNYSWLVHDNSGTNLLPADTDWTPPWSPWVECHREPNYTWGAGYFPWSVPPGDEECDGFESARETYIGTLPRRACPATATPNDEDPDAWPPDFDDNQTVNIVDIGWLRQYFGQTVPPAPQRADLVPDGVINIADVGALRSFFNLDCT